MIYFGTSIAYLSFGYILGFIEAWNKKVYHTIFIAMMILMVIALIFEPTALESKWEWTILIYILMMAIGNWMGNNTWKKL